MLSGFSFSFRSSHIRQIYEWERHRERGGDRLDELPPFFGERGSQYLVAPHEVVAAAVLDPREETLPASGPIRLRDPEHPGATFVLRTGSRRVRERYRAACAAWRQRVERELRRCGADPLWLRTDRSPLFSLGSFFRERAARRYREIG